MAQGPDGNTIIIVKKVSGHGGHHGGSWKVAYADLVTSLMALFLVLWLVSSASQSTREAIASYFRKPGIFQMGSGTPLEIGGAGVLKEAFAPPTMGVPADATINNFEENSENQNTSADNTSRNNQWKDDAHKEEKAVLEKAMKEIKEKLAGQRGMIEGLLGDVEVTLDQTGLHIEIMDTKNASMFAIGSAKILEGAQTQLAEIARVLVELPNKLDIEGHTDSVQFRQSTRGIYDNWDLSSERANSARRVFESSGMVANQLSRVVGFADQKLKNKEDPTSPSNRRISITVRYTDQVEEMLGCPTE